MPVFIVCCLIQWMCKFGDKSTNGQEKTISLGTSKVSVLELDHGKKTPKELFCTKKKFIWYCFHHYDQPITWREAQVYLKQGRQVLKLSLLRAGQAGNNGVQQQWEFQFGMKAKQTPMLIYFKQCSYCILTVFCKSNILE